MLLSIFYHLPKQPKDQVNNRSIDLTEVTLFIIKLMVAGKIDRL